MSEVAYQNAVAYAQGPAAGPRADRRRRPRTSRPIRSSSIPTCAGTLLSIRAFNEAGRALALSGRRSQSDIAHRSPDDKARQAADDHLGLMTPVVKGVLTDLGFDNAVKAQQMFGGHGYIEEWGMSQFVRDARIAMIYEGANGIQAHGPRRPQARQGRRPRRDGLLQRGRRLLPGATPATRR